jgi:GR25 family glycosyltransferase involved in LPS biosynthesis|tara:strand:- start:351 stop:1001 length:651 start_codon:yes stop_codon:yes gene_type:complete
MKNYVITIRSNAMSVGAAGRCVTSGRNNNLKIEIFDAVTPNDDPVEMAESLGLNIDGFHNDQFYSRYENCVAAFMSHFSLWSMCYEQQEEFTIFEHDAIVVNHIPRHIPYKEVISIGKPSYGGHIDLKSFGVNPLTSKRYFPGAHAYRLRPVGAKKLIDQAKICAKPTDIYLNLDTFPNLQEYYPWPVEAKDTFTTIQKRQGCLAKHNYDETYKII